MLTLLLMAFIVTLQFDSGTRVLDLTARLTWGNTTFLALISGSIIIYILE